MHQLARFFGHRRSQDMAIMCTIALLVISAPVPSLAGTNCSEPPDCKAQGGFLTWDGAPTEKKFKCVIPPDCKLANQVLTYDRTAGVVDRFQCVSLPSLPTLPALPTDNCKAQNKVLTWNGSSYECMVAPDSSPIGTLCGSAACSDGGSGYACATTMSCKGHTVVSYDGNPNCPIGYTLIKTGDSHLPSSITNYFVCVRTS